MPRMEFQLPLPKDFWWPLLQSIEVAFPSLSEYSHAQETMDLIDQFPKWIKMEPSAV